MQEIRLENGGTALVDDEDLPLVADKKWYRVDGPNTSYAHTLRAGKIIRMHRLLIGPKPAGAVVDHINRNGLDNRKENLRVATLTQNQANTGPRKKSTSKFKGVSLKKARRAWCAQIQKDLKKIHIGYYDTEEEAAEAYNRAAVKLFGEYAYLNTIPGKITPRKKKKDYSANLRDGASGRYLPKVQDMIGQKINVAELAARIAEESVA